MRDPTGQGNWDELCWGTYKGGVAPPRFLACFVQLLNRRRRSREQPVRGAGVADTAVRLSPLDPQVSFWLYIKGHATRISVAVLRRSSGARISASPSAPYWRDEAKSAIQSLLTLKPGYTVERRQREGWSDKAVFLQEYAHIEGFVRRV